MLILVLTLVVLGALADNNLIFQDWPPILKNFSLYVITAIAIGLTQIVLRRQRRSLAIDTSYDLKDK